VDASCFYDQVATYSPTTLRQRGVKRQSLRIREDLDWLAWPRDPGYSTFGFQPESARLHECRIVAGHTPSVVSGCPAQHRL